MGYQLTLFRPRGTDYARHITTGPPHLFGRCAVSGSYMNLAIKKENGNTKKIKNISLNTFFKICNTFRQQKRVDSFRRKEGNVIFGQNAAISAIVAL